MKKLMNIFNSEETDLIEMRFVNSEEALVKVISSDVKGSSVVINKTTFRGTVEELDELSSHPKVLRMFQSEDKINDLNIGFFGDRVTVNMSSILDYIFDALSFMFRDDYNVYEQEALNDIFLNRLNSTYLMNVLSYYDETNFYVKLVFSGDPIEDTVLNFKIDMSTGLQTLLYDLNRLTKAKLLGSLTGGNGNEY